MSEGDPFQRPPEQPPPKAKLTANSMREAMRIFRYVRPYLGLFIIAHLLLIVSTALGLAFPLLAGGMVDAALAGRGLPEQGNLPKDINTVGLLLLCVVVLQSLFNLFHNYWFAKVGQLSLADLRTDTYNRIIGFPMKFFGQRRVGELTSRIASDISQIEECIVSTIPTFLNQLLIFIGGITLIALTSLQLTAVMFCTMPPLIVAAILFGRWMRRLSKEAQDKLAQSATIVEETLQGIMNVKSFANESYEAKRYRGSIMEFVVVQLKAALVRSLFIAFFVLALFGSIGVVLWFGVRQLEAEAITVGQLTQFVLYTMYVAGAMGSFAGIYSQLQRVVGATQRVREMLEEEPEIVVDTTGMVAEMDRVAGHVSFEHVSFRYPSREDVQVLDDVSFEAESGQRVALVGPSGAGKSTIISLLLRLYDPVSGTVRVDGKDIRDYPLTPYRRQMAIVPQDVMLFGGTIRENIAYGKTDASEQEIHEAARKAHAVEFIDNFPEGYDTIVGERGVKLSGGQRQRIAIARAILDDPAILILDEATSSLDSESERLVQDALHTLMKGKTTLIIAHRLSTIRSADRILVLQEGRIIESGTHEELQRIEAGLYKRLSELQLIV